MKDCPVILIPTFSETDNPRPGYRIGADYIQSVADCGGLPAMLPVTANFGPPQAERWLELADGLLLPGGGDVDPALYGEMPHPKVNAICRGLDDAELLLVKLARQRDLPIFGICRGVQTLAVAHGGSLWQDIPAQCPAACCHAQNNAAGRAQRIHTVTTRPDSLLRRLLGEQAAVNSFHHQAVKEPGRGFAAAAFGPDGLIEAIESQDGRVFGVQWHPENLARFYAEQKNLFAYFVQLCRKK